MSAATAAAHANAGLDAVVPLPDPRVEVRGAAWLEETTGGLLPHRLPAAARPRFPDDFVRLCDEQPAGVRLRLRTAATRLAVEVRVHRVAVDPQPVGPPQRWDVVVDDEVVEQPAGWGVAPVCGVIALDPLRGTTTEHPAPVTTVLLDLGPTDHERRVEVWLPHGETVRLLAVRADAPLTRPRPPRHRPRWVHHGSSISHGASADRPTGTWVATAARAARLDLVNLGMSGNAVLDPCVARAIRDQRADLITLKLGINVVNHDCFTRRSFAPAVHGFLDTVREGHPQTRLVVISPLLCPLVEDVPGPTSIDPASPPGAPVFRTAGRPEDLADGRLTLTAIRDELAAVVAQRRAEGDLALTYVDGRDLWGEADEAELPMADRMHPGPAAHRRIGTRAAALLAGTGDLGLPVPLLGGDGV
ncbi:GDSL-type esterase/lipase family protein [Cellulomonas oligotrophica]|uniref:Lipase n=1 Tax=Cellulomonas oligotrophica TaxID=931536 RepID=A0A7Y9FHA5_9CELL|nr:GDSL-type esterase/lipase family protein [Cellulomonas oligotrophica]NYD85936.1 lysophospholipase L1-like esterase [Cellulomonas oligotrophica]GIG31056.1 lipase [Cellulomonas oligotrophica]